MTRKVFFLAAVVVSALILAGCPAPLTGTNASSPVGASSVRVPADTMNDVSRSVSGPFTYETVYTVGLDLAVELYETDEDGFVQGEMLPSDAARVLVALTDEAGNTILTGRFSPEGTLRTAVQLPAAPADVTMTLSAPGFEPRSVVIEDMVTLERVVRTLSMRRVASAGSRSLSSASLPDGDGDGVADEFDAFPDDPELAFRTNLPSDGEITVAFEDLFGRRNAGDADYNDFIATYTITEGHPSEDSSLVKSIMVNATATTKLAGYNHRFGIRIDAFSGSATLSGTYIDDRGNEVAMRGVVSAPAEIDLFMNSRYAVGESASFTLTFETPQDRETAAAGERLPEAPYNPYVVVDRTGHDIHLINREPNTGSINADDDFVDSRNFPWALLVPATWNHPEEAERIENPYPRFTLWRESGGIDHADWYLYEDQPYVPPEPPVSDPVASMAADINVGGSSNPSDLTVYGGSLYFAADDGVTGNELWSWDGTSATRVSDLVAGAGSGSPGFLTVYGNALYFAGTYDGGPYAGAGFFRYTGATPQLVAGLEYPGYLVVAADGNLYSRGYDDAFGTELWQYDGATASRIDVRTGGSGSDPAFLAAFDGGVYFQANDGTNGLELWRFVGGTAEQAADINPSGSGLPRRLIEYGGALYFQATDGSTGFELWRYDGTGASRITDLVTGTGNGVQNAEMIEYDGALYFAATDGTDGWELYRYDGTTVERVVDLHPGGGDGLGSPAAFAVHDGALYFGGDDGTTGVELYRYDGTSVELVADINASGGSNPSEFAVLGTSLYFQADDGTNGAELWVYE